MGRSIKKKLPFVGERIFGSPEEVEVSYRSSPADTGEYPEGIGIDAANAILLAAFQRRSGEEQQARRCLVGPQRDDLEIRISGRPAASFGSAGEQRRVAFVLTMAVAEMAAESGLGATMVLMDDVEAEFDDERLDRVLGFLGNAVQTLVATSKRNVADRYAPLGRLIEVERGQFRQ